jgi:thiol:disulfide interchange protein
MYAGEVKFQVVLLSIHTFVFLALAVWCLRRGGGSRWALMGAAGAGLLGAAFGIQAASAIENVFFETQHLDRALLVHHHVYTALFAAEALGAIALAGAFVESRRTPPAGTGSIYGS